MGRRGVVVAVMIAIALVVGRVSAEAFAEYQWFLALDALDAWRLQVGHASTLRLLAFTVAATLILANLWTVRRSVVSVVLPRRVGNLEIGEEIPARYLSIATLAVTVLVAVTFTVPARDWQVLALARAGLPFGESDPYFQADLGIWAFWFPFERLLHSWLVALIVTITFLVAIGYALTPSLRWDRADFHLSAWVRRHLSVLGGALLIMLAWSFRLQAFDLLLHGSSAAGVFGATDHQLGLPISTILAYTCFAAAVVTIWAGWSGQPRLAVSVLTLVLLLVPALRWGVPAMVGLSTPPADAALREQPYEAVRAGFTRRAFGLDRLRPMPDSVVVASRDALDGMPIWDPPVLARAISRQQRHGGLVSAPMLTVVAGVPAVVRVAAPTLPTDSTQREEDWSVFRVRAAGTDARGGPAFIDADGRARVVEERVRPVVVWEGAQGARLLPAATAGIVGVPLRDQWVRLAMAWSEQDPRLFGAQAANSVLMTRRDVRDRVGRLVPFLRQASAITPIVLGDSLVWALDLYAVSNAVPLARPLATRDGPLRYAAHAATALISAHSGRVVIVPVADPDPVLRTWARLLPRTLGSAGTLPSEIAERMPALVDGAEWQAEVFAAVGARGEVGVRRHIPALDGSDTLVAGRYQRPVWWASAPGGATTIPLLDTADRVSGLIVALGGATRPVYWHRVDPDPVGWAEVLDSLRGAGQDDPRLVAGSARAVPTTERGWAVVQPYYQWPPDDAPSVALVAIRDGAGVRRGSDLASALGVPAPSPPQVATGANDLEVRARLLYGTMRAALQRGDWVAFGEAMNALGALLDRPRR